MVINVLLHFSMIRLNKYAKCAFLIAYNVILSPLVPHASIILLYLRLMTLVHVPLILLQTYVMISITLS